MRQYLYVFWGLLLAGMVILTAAYPECRQAAVLQYPANRDYAVYDQNGESLFVSGGDLNAHMSSSDKPAGQRRF
ncbi:MAG: hypothetical protein JW832_14865 [Deltaproteobacteria bacterium]|nr:hypothetical protein [Deltaproteobacteria bacterium]